MKHYFGDIPNMIKNVLVLVKLYIIFLRNINLKRNLGQNMMDIMTIYYFTSCYNNKILFKA
jgi:hypothetical protein